MWQDGLREQLTEHMVNRRASRRNTNSSSVPAQRAKKSTVRWTCMAAMQSGDDVDLVFVGFQCADWLGQGYARQRGIAVELFGNAGGGIEALILQEEDDAFGDARLAGGRSNAAGSKRGTKSSTDGRL
jgi:hypothetical protein